MENKNELQLLREKLNGIDEELLKTLRKRFEITKKVGIFKAENNLPPLDESRESEIYKKLSMKAKEMNLSPEMVLEIWKIIMAESKKEHSKIKREL